MKPDFLQGSSIYGILYWQSILQKYPLDDVKMTKINVRREYYVTVWPCVHPMIFFFLSFNQKYVITGYHIGFINSFRQLDDTKNRWKYNDHTFRKAHFIPVTFWFKFFPVRFSGELYKEVSLYPHGQFFTLYYHLYCRKCKKKINRNHMIPI